MANTIIMKKSSTGGAVPAAGSLQPGELAVNLADKKIYSKTTGGTVIEVGSGDALNASTSFGGDVSGTYNNLQVADDSHKHTLYVAGTGTVAGTWLGSLPNVTAYYEGLSFSYKIPIAGASTTTLNINGLGAQTLYFYGTSKVTTHYPVGSVINLSWSPDNGGCFYAQMYYYSTDDYRIRWQNNITAGTLIHGYQLLLEGIDGKYYPVTQGGANVTTNVVSTAEFKIGGNMLWYESATDIAANASAGGYSLFQGYYSGNMEYWSNRSTTAWATVNMPLYLVGTINANGNFVLDNSSYTSFLTQTLPTSDDGKVYVQIGLMGNTSDTMRLDINHPIFWYKDGTLKQFSNYASEAEKLVTARTISLTGDVTGSTSFDGSANVSISAVVADDSHNHIISNVDGLQTALDAKAPLVSPTFTGTVTAAALNMGNGNITNVNHITINDSGVGEGIQWVGGNGWQIYESPDALTNAAGNLQFVTGSTRRATIDTSGNVFGISSVRAPIFYDSNNTAYYTDPASTSVLNALTVGGSSVLTASTTFGGDVSGTYNAIVVADDSHNHIISNVDGLQTALDAKANLNSPSFTGAPLTGGFEIGYRKVPLSSVTTVTADASIVGRGYLATSTVTVPANVFSAGDIFSVINNSAANISISQGTGLTMRLVGTATTGSRTLAQRGIATIMFVSATECIVTGVT